MCKSFVAFGLEALKLVVQHNLLPLARLLPKDWRKHNKVICTQKLSYQFCINV